MSSTPKDEAVTPKETAVFSALNLFQGVPASRVQKMQERSEIREFPGGHVFFELGGVEQKLYLLERGHEAAALLKV